MKHLDLTVFEPGELVATLSSEGKVAVFSVTKAGALVPADNRLFQGGVTAEDTIESLDLSVRTYNALKREGLHTLGQVVAFYDEKGRDGFSDIRNFGEKNQDEIIGHIMRLKGQESAS